MNLFMLVNGLTLHCPLFRRNVFRRLNENHLGIVQSNLFDGMMALRDL